ncbi:MULTISPECIES: ABC transporter substrate-binding protein [unclassified Rhizobium]|uniref:ABC transporter substrate-binding protein n=1 Tax=unclassified Rhizobium TaxID=2613769 RepID=UPI000EA86C82|nr:MULTISPECIES: ABC transporter substrate-binding protein [unclassified Rhizobium]AYG70035.1 ABC transporter substrate-binding protein [Rhizobium sp. CCGE531]AYG76411.1 ABC transporter substrate-binding protein [Rhizobium sp. CCGE532]
MKVLSLFYIAGVTASLVAGPVAAQDAKSTSIVDDRGVTVQLAANPKRIASVSYLAADVALALGIKPTAVTYMTGGRDPDFLLGLTRDAAQIGQRAKPNLELLSQAKPDVIIAMKRYTVGNAAQFEKIAPYIAYNMELLSESYQEVADLSKLFGKPERGEELNAEFKQHLADFNQKAPKNVHPRFVIMWGGDTPFAFHTENTAASIVTALGGDNIVGPMAKSGRFGEELSLETMLEKDPEVIFVYDSGPDRPHENNPIWQQLSAVKNHRVYYVGDHWVETNGPIGREIVLREAAHYLYPDTVPAVDVRKEAAKLIPASLQN